MKKKKLLDYKINKLSLKVLNKYIIWTVKYIQVKYNNDKMEMIYFFFFFFFFFFLFYFYHLLGLGIKLVLV